MASKTETHKDDEREFLARYDVSKFERPSVAVDVSLLAVRAQTVFEEVMMAAERAR